MTVVTDSEIVWCAKYILANQPGSFCPRVNASSFDYQQGALDIWFGVAMSAYGRGVSERHCPQVSVFCLAHLLLSLACEFAAQSLSAAQSAQPAENGRDLAGSDHRAKMPVDKALRSGMQGQKLDASL